MAEQLANDIQTILAADLTAVATKLKPLSSAGFPAPDFRIRIDDELMLVTAVGAEWTVSRGVEGTAAAPHQAGSPVIHLLTRGSLLRVLEEFAQPLDGDLSSISLLTTTPFGRGLLALASASAGRAAFELGSAAQQPSSAFDLAGAAAAAQAAAIAASQPLDADLSAIAALETTLVGRSLLAAASGATIRSIIEAAAAVHASRHQLGGADPLALPQYDPFDALPGVIPLGLWPSTTTGPTAKRAYFMRFTVSRKRVFRFIRFILPTAGTGEDKIDASILAVSGGKFERLGSNGGVKVATNVAGVKSIELGANVTCEPGGVYVVSKSWETVTGTPQFAALLNNSGFYSDVFGTGTLANRIMLFKEATYPIPATVEALGGSAVVPFLVPSES
jgi:hypothetical protein